MPITFCQNELELNSKQKRTLFNLFLMADCSNKSENFDEILTGHSSFLKEKKIFTVSATSTPMHYKACLQLLSSVMAFPFFIRSIHEKLHPYLVLLHNE